MAQAWDVAGKPLATSPHPDQSHVELIVSRGAPNRTCRIEEEAARRAGQGAVNETAAIDKTDHNARVVMASDFQTAASWAGLSELPAQGLD